MNNTLREWTFEEIEKQSHELEKKIPRGVTEVIRNDKNEYRWVGIRQISTDGIGSHLVKAWKKVNEHWEEIDVKDAAEEMAEYLYTKVSTKTIIKEVLLKLDAQSFTDLVGRIAKKPKVTIGIQKGSCVYLYVRGKQGKAFPLQLTE